MLSHLRPVVNPLRRLLAWPFLALGMPPGAVGLVGIVLAAAAAVCARFGWFRSAFALAVIAALTDLADGEVARRTGQSSPEGNYMDAMGDRVIECLLLLGLLPFAPDLVCLALAGGCLTSYAKARCAQVRQIDNRDWPGHGDYPDRALLIAVAYLLLPNPFWPLALLAVLAWAAFAHRVVRARRLIRSARTDDLLPYLRGSATYQR